MPVFIPVFLTLVLVIVSVIVCIVYFIDDCPLRFVGLSVVPTILLLTWLIIASVQPKEVVTEEMLKPYKVQEGTKAIQMIVTSDGKLVNLNDALKGYIPEDAMIQRKHFKTLYFGIDFLNVPDEYSVILSTPAQKKEGVNHVSNEQRQ